MSNVNTSRFKSRGSQAGFSLLEVIAAILLLTIITSSLLIARTQLLRQWQHAAQQSEVSAQADALITSWWSDGFPPPMADGILQEGYMWRTRPLLSKSLAEYGHQFQTIRFSVHKVTSATTATSITSAAQENSLSQRSILDIDMVIPLVILPANQREPETGEMP